jgi:hypothetical protein
LEKVTHQGSIQAIPSGTVDSVVTKVGPLQSSPLTQPDFGRPICDSCGRVCSPFARLRFLQGGVPRWSPFAASFRTETS